MNDTTEYLVGFLYHEPATWNLFNAGIVNEYELRSAAFISATDEQSALEWGETIGEKVLHDLNNNTELNWKKLGYYAWIVKDPTNSIWKDVLDVLPKVAVGDIPDSSLFKKSNHIKS